MRCGRWDEKGQLVRDAFLDHGEAVGKEVWPVKPNSGARFVCAPFAGGVKTGGGR